MSSNFAFKFSLRRYMMVSTVADDVAAVIAAAEDRRAAHAEVRSPSTLTVNIKCTQHPHSRLIVCERETVILLSYRTCQREPNIKVYLQFCET